MNLFKRYDRKKKTAAVAIVLTAALAVPVVTGMPAWFGGLLEVKAISTHEQIRDQAQTNLNNVEDEIEENKDNQNDLGGKIEEKKKKRQELEASIAKKNDELDKVLAELDDLRNRIILKQQEIEQAAADLVIAQDTLDEEYESMKLRIQFMYENNQQDSFWVAILESDGLADMLTRVEYIADVYESDRKLMEQYEGTLREVEDLNFRLTQEMEELVDLEAESVARQEKVEETIASLKQEEEQLASMISDLQSQQRTYETQLAKLEDKKTKYQKTIDEQAEIIRRLEAAAARQDANSYDGGGTGQSNTLGSAAYLKDDSYNPAPLTNISGEEIVTFAQQYVGNPYRWGGNSLTNGADCSGFVHLVFEHFGISTPRYSQSFKLSGQPVSYNNMQAGDVVVYDGHVAIYIGNGNIVEAQSTKAGITNNRSVNCHKITGIRRLV